MGTIEADVLCKNCPSIYCHFINDIFIKVKNKEELRALKEKLATASNLNFTYEESRDGHSPFLDILVTACKAEFTISIYAKDTDQAVSQQRQ